MSDEFTKTIQPYGERRRVEFEHNGVEYVPVRQFFQMKEVPLEWDGDVRALPPLAYEPPGDEGEADSPVVVGG